MPDTPSTKMQYLTPPEMEALNKHLKALTKLWESNTLFAADHDIFDVNGESIGRIIFSGDASSYVFEYYVPEVSDNA